MSSLIRALEAQRARAHVFSEFLDSLHPERSVELADLASDPSAPAKLGIGTWFDQERLRECLASAYAFLENLPLHPTPRIMPLIFFQSNDAEEDRLAFDERSAKYQTFRDLYANTLPEALYLHTRTNFNWEMQGDWDTRNRIITPLYSFSSYRGAGIVRDRGAPQHEGGSVVGYRFPNFPELLGISGAVATDYVTRLVVHDLGHGWLPPVDTFNEPLHDALMVHAMNARPLPSYESPWEALVHRECTNPTFFLDGIDLLKEIDQEALTPVARTLHQDLVTHLGRTASAFARRKLWQLPSKRRGKRGRRHVLAELGRLPMHLDARYAA